MTAAEFTAADRELCLSIAKEFTRELISESANAWTSLALKVDARVRGHSSQIRESDAHLVGTYHQAMLKGLSARGVDPDESTLDKSRHLSRLGIQMLLAARGVRP